MISLAIISLKKNIVSMAKSSDDTGDVCMNILRYLCVDVSYFTFPHATVEVGVVCMQANVEVAVEEII